MRYIRSFTLKDLSLESVLEHLDFFVHNKDRIPQRYIDFLHRLYSKECYDKLKYIEDEDSENEDTLLWFLSSHNKNVFLSNITQNIVDRLQIVGSAITSLTLTLEDETTRVTENVLNSVICCVPHVSYLNLSNTNCSDKTLLCMQKMCPNLVTLDVSNCRMVSEYGILNPCGNNLSLKNLNIVHTAVQHPGLMDILAGIPSLQCVTMPNMATIFDDMYGPAVDSCSINLSFNLTELIYPHGFGPNPLKVIRTWTAFCPNVEKVCILFPVKPDVLTMCSNFSSLKEFEYRSRRYGSYYIGSLEQLTPLLCKANNLTTLRLSHVKLPSDRLFDCLSSMKDLYLNDVTFTDFKEDEIVSKTTNLKCLTIKNLDLDMTRATYKFMALFISLSKNVTELVISNETPFPCGLLDNILNSMKNLIIFKYRYTGKYHHTNIPYSLLKFFDIPSIQQICIDGDCMDKNLFTRLEPTHFSTDSCTLAWRLTDNSKANDYNDDRSAVGYDDLKYYRKRGYDIQPIYDRLFDCLSSMKDLYE